MQAETFIAHFENKLLHFIIPASNTFIKTIINKGNAKRGISPRLKI